MSLDVPKGTYNRTYTNSGSGPTGEADPATVGDFRLDKYLVTVGRFRQFMRAWNGDYRPRPGSGKHAYLNGGLGLVNVGDDAGVAYETGWLASDDSNIQLAPPNADVGLCGSYGTWAPSAGTQENLPINCVSWWESYAFCIWDGGFLPSESEWERAAAGGSQQLEYPWGSTDPGMDNQYAIYECSYPTGSSGCTGAVNIAPVGTTTLGAGRWGQMDMAGEMYEWTLDWFYYNYVDPCTDCAYLTEATSDRVLRGGHFYTYLADLYPSIRSPQAPDGRQIGVGFRCARSP
jgi:formylglycine-generating enzyme required for sulfatase activity